MHRAAAFASLSCIKLLHHHGASLTTRNRAGRTPLEEAKGIGAPSHPPIRPPTLRWHLCSQPPSAPTLCSRDYTAIGEVKAVKLFEALAAGKSGDELKDDEDSGDDDDN